MSNSTTLLRLKEVRINKRLTLKQVALAINLSESTISLYECGKRHPDYSTLIKLADFFGVSVDYLLGHVSHNDFDFEDEQHEPDCPDMSLLHRRITELRRKYGETQAEVASLLNVTQQAYANYETGKRNPSVRHLIILSKHYHITLDCLLGLIGSPSISFAPRLRELRKERDLSQKSLADAVGVDRTAIAKYETGASGAKAEMLEKLATFFGVTTDYLLGRSDIKSPAPEASGTDDEAEIRRFLQQIKDDPSTRMMFDLAKGATLEEIKATVAFLKMLRQDPDSD